MAGWSENLRWLASQPLAATGHGLQFGAQVAPLVGGIAGGAAGSAAGGVGAMPGASTGAGIGTALSSPLNYLGQGSHWLARKLYDPNQQAAQAGQAAAAPQQIPAGGMQAALQQLNQNPQQQGNPQQQLSPMQQANNQLLQQLQNFNQQPFIDQYNRDVAPQIREQFAGQGRGSGLLQGLQQGEEQLASALQRGQQTQQNMLANYLGGQQGFLADRYRAQLGAFGNRGSFLNNMGQLGLQRAGAPVQAGLQASGIGLGQMQSPYMQQGQSGWFPQVAQGLGQAAQAAAPFFV